MVELLPDRSMGHDTANLKKHCMGKRDDERNRAKGSTIGERYKR